MLQFFRLEQFAGCGSLLWLGVGHLHDQIAFNTVFAFQLLRYFSLIPQLQNPFTSFVLGAKNAAQLKQDQPSRVHVYLFVYFARGF